ncbi:hypothetical protein [Blastococcus sp. SYSU DS0617]
MPNYELNQAAVRHARDLIDAGTFDDSSDWSDAAPSTDDGNRVIEEKGWDAFAAWHLAVDPDANEETKKRYAFPYGNFDRVVRAALIHGKQRASQNDHDEIGQAMDGLLERLDDKRGG